MAGTQESGGKSGGVPLLSEALPSILDRATRTLKWAKQHDFRLLDIALNHLALGRVKLYQAILEKSDISNARFDVEQAVSHLRHAGQQDDFARGLFTRAWFRHLTDAKTGPESAQGDLDEAWEIAARGPMKLHMADIHLYRARLFFREPLYPWESPASDLTAAEKLINSCGYHRRDQELADAKLAILGKK